MIADRIQHGQIRLMRPEDIDQVLAIEHLSFDSPWTKNNFIDEFKNSDISIQLVLETEGRIAAFAIVWIIVDECHLANIAVHPDHRRRGLGRLFIHKIIEMARENKCKKVMLEVRKSNEPALALYRSFGFSRTGARKNYYHDGFLRYEDAILMNLDLTNGETA